MSEREESHDSHVDGESQSDGEEVVFREGATGVENSTASPAPTASPQMVTKGEQFGVAPVIKPQGTYIRRNSVRAIPPVDNSVRGHCAPPMLDIGRESGTTGGFPNRPSSKHANRDDHGTTG